MLVDPLEVLECESGVIRESVRCGHDNMPKTFAHVKLLHVNARDLRSGVKLIELQMFADQNDIDVICVSETFFSEHDQRAFSLVGFNHYPLARANGGGGGVSIYARSCLEVSKLSSNESSDQKVQILCCHIKRRTLGCNLVTVYSNHRYRGSELVNMLAEALPEPTGEITIFCGDTNINILENDSLSNDYLSLLASKGLLPVIEGVTRFESQSCLDHIFVTASKPLVHCLSGVIESHIFSDHFPVFAALCVLNGNTPEYVSPAPAPVPRRIFSSTNFLKFFSAISATSFNDVLSSDDVTSALSSLESLLFTEYDKAFPIKRFIPGKWRPASDLFGSEVRKMRRQLDKLRRKYFQNKSDTARKRNYYLALREYKKTVRRLHTTKFEECLQHKDTCSLWRKVNEVLGRSKTRVRPEKLVVNDTVVTDDYELAECFAEFFASAGERAVEHLPLRCVPVSDLLPEKPVLLPFDISKVTSTDVIKFSKSLKTNLAASLETVPSRIIKQVLPLISEPLAHVFNLSINSGFFPEAFKRATVIPLYKGKGVKTDPASYRPISLCPFLAKIFEKAVGAQILAHLRSVNYFSSSQFGFLSGRSTDLALCDIYDYITNNCEGGNAVIGAFLDTSKAFDCVPTKKLLEILDLIGFSLKTQNWLESYMSNRCIRVLVGNSLSTRKKVNIGVPQGSSLGPLIFIIYINVVLAFTEDKLSGLHPVCFADDLTLLYKVPKSNPTAAYEYFISCLEQVGSVYMALRLALNSEKTVITVFRSSQSTVHPPESFTVLGTTLSPSEYVKCLGLHLGSRMDWKAHFTKLRSKCYCIIASISRLRGLGASVKTLVYLYNTLLIPILTYAIVVWGGALPTHLRQLEIMQNDGVRAIYGLSRRDSASALRAQSGLLSLSQLYRLKVGCLMYKELLISRAPSRQHRKRPPPAYHIRGYESSDLVTSNAGADYALRSPRCHHVSIWNQIPPKIRNFEKFVLFKRNLTFHLLNVQ